MDVDGDSEGGVVEPSKGSFIEVLGILANVSVTSDTVDTSYDDVDSLYVGWSVVSVCVEVKLRLSSVILLKNRLSTFKLFCVR